MGVGMFLIAVSFWMMSQFALVMGAWPLILSGFVQGLSMGLLFVPMTTIAFATLPTQYRVQGTTMSNLIRNVGGAVGISLLQLVFVNNMQVAHSTLVRNVSPDNPLVHQMMPGGATPLGVMTINGMAAQQSAFIAYIDDFRLMAVVVICMIPMLLFMRAPKPAAAPAGAGAME